jgi:hypothetical protein
VDRALRPWRELHAPKRVADDEIGVEPPTEVAVEALGALDVRNRNDDDLSTPRTLGVSLAVSLRT